MQVHQCDKCKEVKELVKFPGRFVRRPSNGKLGTNENVQPSKRNFPFWLCDKCWPKSSEKIAEGMYNRMAVRQRTNFKSKLTFTFAEFWQWLQANDFEARVKKTPKAHALNWDERLSIDRINSWLDYRLDNIQILTTGENCSKGNGPAIAARRVTMKFFEKLRDKKKLTKYEMARFLGMLPQTYYYLEEKARGCSFEILCMVKDKMGLSWEEMGLMIEKEVKINTKEKKEE
jgi:DNA-binding XRE family transcriptional regulator